MADEPEVLEPETDPVKMVYNGTGDFKASDFEIVGEIAEPVTTIRPKLL